MNSTILLLFCISNLIYVTARNEEKCYSCSSANFENRWPKDKNSTLLYLRNFAMVSNESCDNIRSALPTVPCPDSVCVKFVVQGAASNRAVCSSSLNPIIVRDCWSRVLTSESEDLKLKPYSSKPIKLAPLVGQEKSIGHIYTCTGYLCNGDAGRIDSYHIFLLAILVLFSL